MNLQYITECFEIDPSSPSGLSWSKTRPKSHFVLVSAYYCYMRKKAGKPCGELSAANRYWRVKIKKRTIAVHRIVFMLHNNTWITCGQLLDHEDRNKSNNKPSNIRLATDEQNNWNRSIASNNTTGYKGVFKSKDVTRVKKYIASIMISGKRKCIGYFYTAEEANLAYQKAAIEMQKDFAPVINASMN